MMILTNPQIQPLNHGHHMLAHSVASQILIVLLNVPIRLVGNGSATIKEKRD